MAQMLHDQIKTLCTELTRWMYSEPERGNVGERSNNGQIIGQKNASHNIAWILPDSFNTKNRPKVERTITLPAGRDIICVAASSHASEREAEAQGTTAEKAVENLDGLFDAVSIKLNDDEQVKKDIVVETEITIPQSHPVLAESNALGLGYKPNTTYTFKSKYRYALIKFDDLGQGLNIIKVYAHSPEKKAFKEIEHESSVVYQVIKPGSPEQKA